MVSVSGCGDDPPPGPPGNEATFLGVGSACSSTDDCDDPAQECLPFKGGYCGIADCVDDADCPDGSACVTHTDNNNYCFLLCNDKADCNVHRPLDDEANCVSSIVFVESGHHKACEPPSG
jgi:hypothetical protein